MKKITATKHRKISGMSAEYRLDYTKAKPNRFAKRIPINKKKITEFCKRWQISEFSFFGSVLRDDFRPDSDVDVLVSFQPESKWSLWDLIEMQEELEKMFSRKVDFVEKEAIRNPYRRHSILNGREIFYAATERDGAYVWDILDSARAIQGFMSGVRFEEFLRDRKLQLAIERCVEIMGEASRRISDDFKQANPEIPWSRMIAQRNVISHEYDDVKQERMWLVATVHVPGLIPQLEAILLHRRNNCKTN